VSAAWKHIRALLSFHTSEAGKHMALAVCLTMMRRTPDCPHL